MAKCKQNILDLQEEQFVELQQTEFSIMSHHSYIMTGQKGRDMERNKGLLQLPGVQLAH